ncbi:unnamed protein product [Ilex paraguariensis]|uniref:Uncharacterized protein n=1 Tax=Ilex paraguariensis TaxID=185542 RepID=A0ABC8R7X0_9AQUA
MASGSSGRNNNSGSKGFDFVTDDILCSYEDYGNQESSNGSHSEPVIGINSTKVLYSDTLSRLGDLRQFPFLLHEFQILGWFEALGLYFGVGMKYNGIWCCWEEE